MSAACVRREEQDGEVWVLSVGSPPVVLGSPSHYALTIYILYNLHCIHLYSMCMACLPHMAHSMQLQLYGRKCYVL